MSWKQVDERTGRYLPILYPEEMPYWEAARRRELRLQRCLDCGKVWYPIGPVCPFCLSESFEWALMSGKGVISTFVLYHKGWAPWMEAMAPYAVVQVELPEGPRLTTNLMGIPASEVRIGMPVEVCFEDITDDITLVQFRPAAG